MHVENAPSIRNGAMEKFQELKSDTVDTNFMSDNPSFYIWIYL